MRDLIAAKIWCGGIPMTGKEKKCCGDHEGHLCVLAGKEMFEEIKQITKKPEYICFNCGRVADEEKNLCNPMSLND